MINCDLFDDMLITIVRINHELRRFSYFMVLTTIKDILVAQRAMIRTFNVVPDVS